MITCRKIKLTIINEDKNELYKLIRNEMRTQNRALNEGMNHLYFNFVAKNKIKLADNTYKIKEEEKLCYIERLEQELQEAKTDKQKEKIQKSLTKAKEDLNKHRKNGNKEASEYFKQIIQTNEATNLRDFISDKYELMSDTKDRLTKIIRQDFSNDIAEILKGERPIRKYRKDNPLYIRGRALKLYKEDNTYYFKWVKGTIFKCVLACKRQNSLELERTLDKIISEEYSICDSSMQFDRKNHLILNLTLDIPENKENSFVDGRVVGVDLGMKIPAYCSLNDVSYIKQSIGDINDFLRVRKQMQERRRRLQHSLMQVKGGKGRDKKLKALDRFSEKEKNFAQTYNHFVSKQIVEFAKKNKAGQINLELLKLGEEYFNAYKKNILRNWSYYQLQQMIEFKAQREGIIAKYIDPYRTSQTCSICGHYEKGQRLDQETFICKSCGQKLNADYNASRNIAKSTQYVEKAEDCYYYKIHKKLVVNE